MTSVSELAEELATLVEFQEVPRELGDDDYEELIKRALRKLYVDTGRAQLYSSNMFKFVRGQTMFDADLPADEIEYVLCVAQIQYFKIVRASVDQMVSYTTDALSVANADKPYANIDGTISQLENERRIIYYKMVRYTLNQD